jgi:HAD superfamily hydrolase (TIGR01458 family)
MRMRQPTKFLSNVKGILCDIDGTLYFKGSPIPGAIETLSELRKRRKNLLFLTNTDSKAPETVLKKLIKYGFSVEEHEIFTPIIALQTFLLEQRDKKIFLVASKDVEEEFKEFSLISDDEVPDYVIISDFSDDWDVNRLNRAFKYLLKGAKLFGTQGNRYCLNHEGEPQIDTGSFVRMLADAADVPYTIFGKPSKNFFVQALNKLGLKANECVIVGDDLESDIQGAKNAGMRAVLVKTGKTNSYVPSKNTTKPFLIIDTFKLLLDYL